MRMTLTQFVEESNRIEGIFDNHSLSRAIIAHEWFLGLEHINVSDIERFVGLIQTDAVLRRAVGVNVRVGNYVAPPE